MASTEMGCRGMHRALQGNRRSQRLWSLASSTTDLEGLPGIIDRPLASEYLVILGILECRGGGSLTKPRSYA